MLDLDDELWDDEKLDDSKELQCKMENYRDNEMRKIIEDKLGFNIKEYNRREQEALKKMMEAGQCDSHECDNIPSPFEKLSLEELEYLREHNYFLDWAK